MQTALVDWVKEATGLANVYMADQNGHSIEEIDELAYATLRLGQFLREGHDEVARSDGVDVVTYTVRSFGLMVVTLQTYSPNSNGTNCALELAMKARRDLALPSVHSMLATAGMSVADPGSVLSVPAVVETKWRGRAVCDVRFNVRDDVSEDVEYIESVSGTFQFTPPSNRPTEDFEAPEP